METKYSTAESFGTLTIGFWTVSLISYLTSGTSGWIYFLIALGAISALFGLYLILPCRWAQESTLELLRRRGVLRIVKVLGWLLVIVVFGVGLVLSKILWMIIAGMITMIIAYIVFYVGIWKMNKDKG